MTAPRSDRWGDVELVLALVAATAVIALPDIVVLEWILKPISREHGLPWSTWQMDVTLFGATFEILTWWPGLWAIGVALPALLAWVARRWEALAGGLLLFACGWEDTCYYLLQLKGVPDTLPWLDLNPFLAWTRLLTGAAHVTRAGLLVANALALAATAALILFVGRRRRAGDPK